MDNTRTERTIKLRERRISDGWKRVDLWLQPGAPTYAEVVAELKKLTSEIEWRKVTDATAIALTVASLRDLIERMEPLPASMSQGLEE